MWKTFGMVIIKYLITINIIYLSVNNRLIHNYLCHQQIKYFRGGGGGGGGGGYSADNMIKMCPAPEKNGP